LFKVLSGSLREAFGVQREHRVWDMPKGMNIISNEFKDPKFLADDLAKEIKSAIKMAMAPGSGGEAQVSVEDGEMSVKVTLPCRVMSSSTWEVRTSRRKPCLCWINCAASSRRRPTASS
jgi:hypothetical protein